MMNVAPILTVCRARVAAGLNFVAGFVREHAPESSVRLCMVWFAATACVEAHRIVSFAFLQPTEHLMVGELAGLVATLLGTGVCGMALRTRSDDSAQAKLEQLAAGVARKVTDAAGGGSP